MRRFLSGLLAAAALMGSAAAAPFDETTPPPAQDSAPVQTAVDYTAAADALYALGLFQGKGVDAAGRPIYDLAAPCTRAEAAVMLVRLLGREEEAQTAPGTPFTDLADWQKPAVNWLYRRGLASGASYDKFEPEARCTAQMYATFMLRALGYSDQKGDFTYAGALAYAGQVGLIDLFSCDTADFRRDDAVQMSRMALLLPEKDGTGDLLGTLTEAGVVEPAQADAFRAVAQPVTDLQAALASRKPYQAQVFAALTQAEDSLSFTGTLHTDGTQTVCEGMLSVALRAGRSDSGMVRIVRVPGGIYIGPLDGMAYRDDQIARLLRESGLLDLLTAELPAQSLITDAGRQGREVTMQLSGGQATLGLDAGGQPALRTLSMTLRGVSYAITVETTDPSAGAVPQWDRTGMVRVHAV